MPKLTEISWEEFSTLSLEAKSPYLERSEGDGMPYHTLFAQQFDRRRLERLCALANRIRFINKSKEGALFLKSVLAHKRAMLYFSQPSSRTFRLRGKGVPSLRGGGNGDLDVRLVFEVPANLDRKQKEALETFQKLSTQSNFPEAQRLANKTKVFFAHRDKLRK